MSEQKTTSPDPRNHRSNRIVAGVCVAFFGGMIGASYAAVPLYQMFCQITGYGGTTQRVDQYSDTILDRDITIRFDANTSGGLPWDFAPEKREIKIKIGETVQANYHAANNFSVPSGGRATFNVTPDLAGAYFNKVECFCFTDTTLQPGENMEMPVVFYVDPEIVNVPEMKNIKTITLSYTFFPIAGDKPVAKAPDATTKDKTQDADENLGG
jgi:cytochrome c oxidase assembly protein subunit 11